MSKYFQSQTVAHYLNTYLFSNGTWIYNQINNSQRWSGAVFCHRTENLKLFPFNNIYSLNSLTKSSLFCQRIYRKIHGYFPYFLKALKAENARIIHAHFGPAGYEAIKLSVKTNIPIITTFYGYDASKLLKIDPKWIYRYKSLFSKGNMFLVEGTNMRKQLIQLGCQDEKIRIQHLGVDLDKIAFQPRKISNDGIVKILAAATFTEKKGLIYAIEAFCILSNIYNNLKLTIIGDARADENEQAIKKKLLALVAQYQIQDKVTFTGYQPYDVLYKFFYDNHIFLSPSVQAKDGDNEGGAPVTIIEASASGMPVVSTKHCDIPSVIIENISGFLSDEKDVVSLVNNLRILIENNELWPIMGSSGRKHIEQEYNLKKTIASLENKYEEVLKN